MTYTPDARCAIVPGGLLCALVPCPTGAAQGQANRLRRHDGNDVDVLAMARIGRTALAARYAGYRADRVATLIQRFCRSTEPSL